MTIIKKFDDESYFSFQKGEFDRYQIIYTEKGLSDSLSNLKVLRKIKHLVQHNIQHNIKDNNCIKSVIKKIYNIQRIDSDSFLELDKVIESIDLQPRLFWMKLVYSICILFYAQDNWSRKGNEFGRDILEKAIYRVIDGEDPEIVAKMFHNKSRDEIKKMLRYENKDNKQKTVLDSWE